MIYPIYPARIWAVFLFLLCWGGYVCFAKKMAHKNYALPSLLRRHRDACFKRKAQRETCLDDDALLSNFEGMIAFFASALLLI